jgi:hypothetical protein
VDTLYSIVHQVDFAAPGLKHLRIGAFYYWFLEMLQMIYPPMLHLACIRASGRQGIHALSSDLVVFGSGTQMALLTFPVGWST